MDRLAPDSQVTRNPKIISGIVDAEMVTADIDSGNYRHLNRTGTRIWELLKTPRTLEDICLLLSTEFRVAPDGCVESVDQFLQALAARDMVSWQPGPPSATGEAEC